MLVNPNRSRALNNQPQQTGPIVYWMSRDQRVHHNWALIKAQEEAVKTNQPLIVVFSLLKRFLEASPQHVSFMLSGLQQVAETLNKYNIPFFLLEGTPEATIPVFLQAQKVGLLVTDFSPLTISRRWKADIAESIPMQMIEVDAHNIIPAWITSAKQEFAAYTIRPKIHKLLPTYLEPFPEVTTQSASLNHSIIPTYSHSYDWIIAGEQAAQSALYRFLDEGIEQYNEKRNDPNEEAQSQLSPYLHFGQISSQDIVLKLLQKRKKQIEELIDPQRNGSASKSNEQAFVEELVVRKELSDNFCLYNQHYDTVDGFPDWAKKSHEQHRHDPREFVYSLEELEQAKTHDQLWNAAQQQMVTTGKMHGYMRMYWAKKILEWTTSPQEAMKFAIYLNDHYSLDGRDPNGYTGIAWSIGGVHDRAWFDRPIFGKIRYMSYNGCKSKFDLDQYIKKWTTEK